MTPGIVIFLTDKICSSYSCQFCFSENNASDSPAKHMHSAQHSLALCYNASQLNIIEVNYIPSVLEILPTVLKLEKVTFISYAFLLGNFIDRFTLLIIELLIRHGILIVGDFYVGQMLPVNVGKVGPLIQTLNLTQR